MREFKVWKKGDYPSTPSVIRANFFTLTGGALIFYKHSEINDQFIHPDNVVNAFGPTYWMRMEEVTN